MRSIFFLLVLSFSALAGETYYCVQMASSRKFEDLRRAVRYVSTFPYVRIEKIGDLYTLRAGFFKKRENAIRLLRRAREVFKDAFVRECDLVPERIVLPRYEARRSKFFTYDLGMRLAQLYIKRKEYEKAESIYRELSERYPDSGEVRLQLARVLFWQGKYEESLKIYRELEKLDPSLADERRRVEVKMILEKVDRLEKEGRLEEAIELLEKLYEEEKSYDTGMRLGRLYIRTGKRKEARRVFAHLMKKYPQDREIREIYSLLQPRKIVKKNSIQTTYA